MRENEVFLKISKNDFTNDRKEKSEEAEFPDICQNIGGQKKVT